MNRNYSNVITNYHMTTGGAEFYATIEADEIVQFKDKNGNTHKCDAVRIDSNATDLLIQFVRVDSDGVVKHDSDTIVISAGSYVSYDNVNFNAIKIIGALGQNVKYTALY